MFQNTNMIAESRNKNISIALKKFRTDCYGLSYKDGLWQSVFLKKI